jgi:hypothetical protein
MYHPHRFMSTMLNTTTTKKVETRSNPGSVTRTLRVLDMDVVKKILADLKSVDTNSDQR